MADDGMTSDADDLAQALQKIVGAPARGLRREGVDYQAALLALIDEFLAGALTFDDLETQFSDCFIEELHEDDISAESFDFFSRVHEKLSWTGPVVDKKDRSYGWIDPAEFSRWLSSERAAFEPGGAPA
jgi:hypothetical protein